MNKVDNRNNLTFKIRPRKSVWKLPYDVFGHFRKNFGIEIALKDFQIILDNAYVYYLNEMGLSVNTDGSKVEKTSAQYMWTQLDKCKNAAGEQLYVWMIKKGRSSFGNIAFGTKSMFDATIVKNLNLTK